MVGMVGKIIMALGVMASILSTCLILSCPFAINIIPLSFLPFPDPFSTSVGPWTQGTHAEDAARPSRRLGVSGFCLICLSILASRFSV